MYIKQLTRNLAATIPLLQRIADGKRLSFDEAWSLVTIYKRYKDSDKFIDYVESLPKSVFGKLRDDVTALRKETGTILHIYSGSKEQFKNFDAKAIYKQHLEPLKSAYEQAKEVSIKAYKEYKELDNNLDVPELRFSEDELPHIWEQHAQKKEYSDKCSKHTKELFEVYDRERRRTAGLFNFKLSALVMLVYSLDEMSKALLADLNDIVEKEGNG